MHQDRLKNLVETGGYRPHPALIAEAMLKRRGVRELLSNEVSRINPGGRTQSVRASDPRAA